MLSSDSDDEPTESAGRQTTGLRPPVEGDAEAVPAVGRQEALWRACGRNHARPWWYSSRTDNARPGRFDLELPNGTAYWATHPETAIMEAATDPDEVDGPLITYTALQNLLMWSAKGRAAGPGGSGGSRLAVRAASHRRSGHDRPV